MAMEEKKKKVTMKPNAKVDGKTVESPEGEKRKLTYDELVQLANQLSESYRNLMEKFREQQMNNVFTRLNYLFQIVRYSSEFEPELLDKALKEIQDLMFPENNGEDASEGDK